MKEIIDDIAAGVGVAKSMYYRLLIRNAPSDIRNDDEKLRKYIAKRI